ncbi:bifunctional 5,10-methylene-tetrahydrofolate dehydrogenase/5,10-methylene-tetrahydrofolate cyclohydrolase [Rubrobacter taiwanensis]|uniref:Bifunctional protein FolD n=1 Tax=Rubrobacter taiwanensis TaxID=185139 RepID=A0A4R1BCK4_9ACTN|nr:tetrahydrofolate dehydrogenase/cyclohydrolase catalytic domain-containing protein [Rubrobacter taiwanensis]TCJ14785.1 bifunctional 5,10-methylene-tetrahydrofolate dehydrogenase/5,10-methylene-tetrahydrofolate cyclohydrolase [Rubrobacter taiwanensis]
MGAHLIDGRTLAGELKDRVASEARELAAEGVRPGLATVLVGEDYAARVYERRVGSLAGELGCRYVSERLPRDAGEADVLAVVGKLNADPRVSGILVLRPLPQQVSEPAVFRMLNPLKDIEAVHPVNAGLLALGRARYVPSTPAACFYLLDRYLENSGREPRAFYPRSTLVVVGRSNNVGKPAISLGFARNATVISCDVNTYRAGRLREHTLRADVLIVAAGVPNLIDGSYVREGVIVIDVGINPVEDRSGGGTKLVGDLDFRSVAGKAEALTPVPGGVGPVTDVWLLRNTVSAARRSLAPGRESAVGCPSASGISGGYERLFN